jgi:predicted RNA-binding Zn ribbon-like protein
MNRDETRTARIQLALDLLNTAGRGSARATSDRGQDGTRLDALGRPADAVAWMVSRGLLGRRHAESLSPAEARRLQTEALRLRDDAARALEAYSVRRRIPAAALFGINRALEAGRPVRRLESTRSSFELVERWEATGPLSALAPVAHAAARLLVETSPSRLRRCASSSCGAWFLDTSKGGQRKWCSMARCGNRAKAARRRRLLAGS